MTTFNTGNPIGSTDARDRLDNSENMDILENSTTLNAHADRLGVMRKTRKGMELEHDNQISAHESEHDAQMQSFENDFDSRLAGMAFTRVGTFADGYTLTDMRQTLLWEISQGGDGREYGWTGSFLPSGKVVAAGSTPATSGGIGAGAWVDRSDVTLRSDLASESGSGLVGYQPSGTGAVPTTVQSAIRALYASENQLSPRTSIPAWDDFDAPDGPLNGRVTPSGHTWSVSGLGASTAAISNGAMVNTAGENMYPSIRYGGPISHIHGVFSFTAGTVNSGPQVVLIMQSDSLDLLNMLHLQISPNGWSLDKRVGGVWTNRVAQGRYDLSVDGTPYRVSMWRSGTTLTIDLPDSSVATYTDADVASLDLRAGTWQITGQTAGQWQPRWHAVGIGDRLALNRGVLLGAVAPGELRRVAGFGLGQRRSRQWAITADGWYRICGPTTIEGFTILGTAKIHARGLLTSQFHADVVAVNNSQPRVTTRLLYGGYNMPNVRIGTDELDAHIDVQIANVSAAPGGVVTLTLDTEGFFAPYQTPVASPATPKFSAVTPITAPAVTSTSAVINTTGWARLATRAPGPGGWLMNGIVRVRASDAGRMVVFDVLVHATPGSSLRPLQIVNCVGWVSPISQVRISRDSSANALALDINCAFAGTNACTVQAEFIGWFTPDTSMTTGVAALATETLTFSVIENRQQPVLVRIRPEQDETISYTTVSSGSTITMDDTQGGIYQLSGGLDALTVTLPPNPRNGQVVTIGSAVGVATLTVNAAAGHTVWGSSSFTAAASTEYAFRFRSANLTWYRTR